MWYHLNESSSMEPLVGFINFDHFLEHLLSLWVLLIGYHLWVDLDITYEFLMKYLSLDTTWNIQTRYPFALLSCACTLITIMSFYDWLELNLICLSTQVRFDPMTSFFTPLLRVILSMLYLSLVLSIQIKSSTWVH